MKEMSSFRRATLLMSFVLAVSAVGMPGSPALAAVGPEDPWAPGTNWVSLRAGSARSGEANAPESGYGVGFGYSKMLGGWLKKFSLGAYIHFENLGSLGDATEYSIPVTLEMARHIRLTREIQPYLGFGGGAYYRKLYRTGDDTGTFEPGFYILLGANTPIYKAGVLGFDLRLNWVDVSSDDPNPVFAPKESTTTQMGLKINYSIVY